MTFDPRFAPAAAPQFGLQPAAAPAPSAPPQGFAPAPQGQPAFAGAPQHPAAAAFQQAQQDPTQAAFAALQGLNEATGETQYPWLPGNVQAHVKIEKVRLFNGTEIGIAFIQDVKVLRSSDPSIQPGSMYSLKIDGFKSVQAAKFALNDLKQFMACTLASRGLTLAWQGDWISSAIHMAQQDWCVGFEAFVQTSLTKPGLKSGKQKIKALWYPATPA